MPVPGDKITLKTYQDIDCNVPDIDPKTNMVSCASTDRCSGTCHVFAGAPGAPAEEWEDLGPGPVEHQATLLYTCRCVDRGEDSPGMSGLDVVIEDDFQQDLDSRNNFLKAIEIEFQKYQVEPADKAPEFDLPIIDAETSDQYVAMHSMMPVSMQLPVLADILTPKIPGTTGVRPQDPLGGLDLEDLARILFGVMDPRNPLLGLRYLCLIMRLLAWLRFLQEIEDALRRSRGRLRDGSDEVREIQTRIFGTTDHPLGLGGPTVTPDNINRYGKHVCGRSGDVQVDFSEALKAVIGRALDAIVTATLGRLGIAGLTSFGSNVAEAFVNNLNLSGTYSLTGEVKELWMYSGQIDRPQRFFLSKCRRAEDTSYDLTNALNVRTIQSLELALDLVATVNQLLQLVRDALSQPGDVFGRLISGNLQVSGLSGVTPQQAAGAARQLYEDLERIGDRGGLQRTATKLPTATDRTLEISWERHVKFIALAGPDGVGHLPYHRQEIYPVDLINTVVVPPGSNYFLRWLYLDYSSHLRGSVTDNFEDAIKRALEQAITATFNEAIDKIKDDITDRVRQGLGIPSWAEDFARGLRGGN